MNSGEQSDKLDAAAIPLLAEGLRLFNEQKYFECHEVLEELWNQQPEPERQFTQGVIQIAVGLYHLRNGNLVGARKLLPRGLSRVKPFAPTYLGIEVAAFVLQVQAIETLIATTSAECFDAPKIKYCRGA